MKHKVKRVHFVGIGGAGIRLAEGVSTIRIGILLRGGKLRWTYKLAFPLKIISVPLWHLL